MERLQNFSDEDYKNLLATILTNKNLTEEMRLKWSKATLEELKAHTYTMWGYCCSMYDTYLKDFPASIKEYIQRGTYTAKELPTKVFGYVKYKKSSVWMPMTDWEWKMYDYEAYASDADERYCEEENDFLVVVLE